MADPVAVVARLIGSFCFVGHVPVAPGTAATFAALFLVWIGQPSPALHLLILAAALIAGTWSAGRIERMTGVKDNGIIVIDEVAGALVSVAFLPLSFFNVAAAFFLFRVFDILKPPPIRWIERVVPGGAGVMLDDVAAGIAANLVLQILRVLNI